jgi:hypothetical protein
MANETVPPAAPPPGTKIRKSHVGLIVGAVVVFALLKMMGAFGHSSSSSANTPAPATASGTDATSAPVPAPAPAAVPAAKPAGGNPILGTWTLVDTDMAAYCKPERSFVTYQEATANHEVPAIYVVQPTYVEVSYGGSNIEEWELHGPDDVTLRMASPSSVGYSDVGAQAQTNCRYHRK